MKLNVRILNYPLLMFLFVLTTGSTPEPKVATKDPIKKNGVPTNGTVTDKDGNVYKTVTIGTQVWMAENLRTTKYQNGDPIPQVLVNTAWSTPTSGAYCWYNNDATAKSSGYGALYNWAAVDDNRDIAPKGWHVPSDAEWTVLAKYLGGNAYAGGKLKEPLTNHWSDPNAGATNSSGFTALPAGYRNNSGVFGNAGIIGGWWSISEYSKSVAWYRYVDYNTGYIYSVSTYKTCGFSVRCVKD
jgi:uncharacterized protein (TIGR02145 family)